MSDSHSRRTVLSALAAGTAASVPALAVAGSIASHPDEELLRLGVEFDRLRAAYARICEEYGPAAEAFNEKADRRGLHPAQNYEAWAKFHAESGLDALATKTNDVAERVDAATKEIRGTPAKALAGIAIKARALRFDTGLDSECVLNEGRQPYMENLMEDFIAEIECLAASKAV